MPRPVPLFCRYFIIASPLAFAQSIDLAAPIAPVSALESLRISAAGELGKQEDECHETQSHNSPRALVRGGYFQGGKCRVRDDSCEQICEKGVAFLPLNSLVGRVRSGCCARARSLGWSLAVICREPRPHQSERVRPLILLVRACEAGLKKPVASDEGVFARGTSIDQCSDILKCLRPRFMCGVDYCCDK